ncbi:G-protein coupled receptor 143 [Perognathus longimembris pacificus]|uniref:G-protein coupled receptor 143 n=1 Tax=Perognathus longimembris pacificus TaxID=214514 RepID=UPI002018CEFB|nr:G-protein coupled receptor 143 [Perognathus longimembris pacificus]
MASPRLAAFCCPKQDAGSRLLLAMPPRAFHALRLACGALSLAMRLRGPPQRSAGDLEPSPSLSPTHILRHAATCDTLGCLGLVLQSAVWLGFPGAMPGLVEDGETWAGVGPTAFCVASALWIQLFYAACFYWLFCYALDSYLVVRRSSGVSTILVYRLMSWGLAGLLCAEGALVLYSPSLSRCEGSTMQVLPLHLATYLPLLLAMLGIPVLRRGTLSAVDSAIKGGQGVYTARERKAQALVGRRLLRPGVVLGACWGCNLLNEGLLLYLDTQPSLGERAHRGLRQAATTTWVMAISRHK